MKGKKIIIISIIINILLISIIYNYIKKNHLNNEKIVVKALTETEYENNITTLNQSHTDYANYIQESKTKIANSLTDMGVTTSDEETFETMANNIKNIAGKFTKQYLTTFTIDWLNTTSSTTIYITKTYDCTLFDGYENFTTDNFSVELNYINGSNRGNVSSISKFYENGILTCKFTVYSMNGGNTADFDLYLVSSISSKTATNVYSTTFTYDNNTTTIPINLNMNPNYISLTGCTADNQQINYIWDNYLTGGALVKAAYYATSQTIKYINVDNIFPIITNEMIQLNSGYVGAGGFIGTTWHIVVAHF